MYLNRYYVVNIPVYHHFELDLCDLIDDCDNAFHPWLSWDGMCLTFKSTKTVLSL